MQHLDNSVVKNAYDYKAYRQLIEQKLAEKQSTGTDHSVAMLNYTSLNVARMRRWDKKSRISETTREILKKINQPLTWLVITEGWCGDAAQIVPVLQHMATESEQITLRFILRDKYLPVIDAFLTNGARSIPKVIILNTNTLEVMATWGPRPDAAQQLVLAGKKQMTTIEDQEIKREKKEETSKDLHLWYAKDKTMAIQREFSAVLSTLD